MESSDNSKPTFPVATLRNEYQKMKKNHLHITLDSIRSFVSGHFYLEASKENAAISGRNLGEGLTKSWIRSHRLTSAQTLPPPCLPVQGFQVNYFLVWGLPSFLPRHEHNVVLSRPCYAPPNTLLVGSIKTRKLMMYTKRVMSN